VIFSNPSGAPELACDQCGCRWFDRMSNTCYECGAAVTPENLAEIEAALAAFAASKQMKSTSANRSVFPAKAGTQNESFGFPPSRE
jgi:hypothetical protein